jgi:hypothetical protein
MRNVLAWLIFAAVAAVALQRTAEAADGVGVSTLAVPVPERGGTMDATLWYPAGPGGQSVLVGKMPFSAAYRRRRMLRRPGVPVLSCSCPKVD